MIDELNPEAKWVWKSVDPDGSGTYSVECIKLRGGEVVGTCSVDGVEAESGHGAVEEVLKRLENSLI